MGILHRNAPHPRGQLRVKLRLNCERKNGAPPRLQLTQKLPWDARSAILAARLTIEAKVAANRTPREAGVCSSTSALNGRWRLISAMYACAREGPYKIPCA